MSIVHVKGSGKSSHVDRTLFTGPTLPDEVKKMIKPLKKIEQNLFRSLLQVAVKDFEGKEVTGYVFDGLTSDSVSEETLCIVYAGLQKLLRLALRIPLTSMKQEIFMEDLRSLNIPEAFISDLASAVFGSRRVSIDGNAVKTRPKLPHLNSYRWRVDVAISTSAINRALQPTVLVEMTLSDGKVHQFEMDVAKFHELRYSVSSVLKDIEDIEKRSILKIQDKT